MLECVLIIRHVVVVIVGVGKECVARGKHIGRAEVGGGELSQVWILDDEEVLAVVAQVFAQLVAQVGVGVAVADDLHGLRGADAAMVGGDDDLVVALREMF